MDALPLASAMVKPSQDLKVTHIPVSIVLRSVDEGVEPDLVQLISVAISA